MEFFFKDSRLKTNSFGLVCSFYLILEFHLDYRWFTIVFNRQQLGMNATVYYCILLEEYCVLKIKMKHSAFILLGGAKI